MLLRSEESLFGFCIDEMRSRGFRKGSGTVIGEEMWVHASFLRPFLVDSRLQLALESRLNPKRGAQSSANVRDEQEEISARSMTINLSVGCH